MTRNQRISKAVPPVEKIEMVQGDYLNEPADPVWRVQVSGFCADLPTETAANNFRNAILAIARS